MKYYLFIILIIIACISISCGSKDFNVAVAKAINSSNAAMNYLLRGERISANTAYSNTITIFIKRNDLCNAARTGILLYTADPIEKNITFLNDAKKYATIGVCLNETDTIDLLKNIIDNETINLNQYKYLEEPMISIATAYVDNSTKPLENLINLSSTSDRLKSMLARIVAKKYMVLNIDKTYKYINIALEIDEQNGWTQNILYDQQLTLETMEIQNKNIATQIELIKLLQDLLNNTR